MWNRSDIEFTKMRRGLFQRRGWSMRSSHSRTANVLDRFSGVSITGSRFPYTVFSFPWASVSA